jgi:flagellar biogenesis protein FliO
MGEASDAMMLARLAGSLVTVLLLALLAARFARRTTRGRPGGDLRVCERVGLTRDTAAVVLETGGRRLLVGIGPHQVTLLADLTEPMSAFPQSRSDVPAGDPVRNAVPAPRISTEVDPETGVVIHQVPLSRKVIRELDRSRRRALPPTQRGTGSALDPRTWQQGVEALRDLTARRR